VGIFDTPTDRNEQRIVSRHRLGRKPAIMKQKAVLFSDFFKYLKLPKETTFWDKRRKFPIRSFGNTEWGNCTIAKQAVAHMRMERIETGKTPTILDEEIIAVYKRMILREYGSEADEGAYEVDALDNWRNPEQTFRDKKGNPLSIDGYMRVNHLNHDEVKAALALSAANGIAVCFNLPVAWSSNYKLWSGPPAGTPLTGIWQPGGWGGHSMWEFKYNEVGPVVDQTWKEPPTQLTWDAMFTYCDEIHIVIDSVNKWKKSLKGNSVGKLDLGGFVDAVNAVSSIPIAA
jgi:hypothetical protein